MRRAKLLSSYLLSLLVLAACVVPAEHPRRVPLSKALNFRDAGGYVTDDGQQVRKDVLFRSDTIADLIDIDGLERPGRLLLAHGIVGLAEATARHWVPGGSGLDLDEAADHVAELAWSGLRAPQRSAD